MSSDHCLYNNKKTLAHCNMLGKKYEIIALLILLFPIKILLSSQFI
jgi:hypothetical protein